MEQKQLLSQLVLAGCYQAKGRNRSQSAPEIIGLPLSAILPKQGSAGVIIKLYGSAGDRY